MDFGKILNSKSYNQVCKYASMQLCTYAHSMQVCKYTSMLIYASMQVYATMQVYNPTNSNSIFCYNQKL